MKVRVRRHGDLWSVASGDVYARYGTWAEAMREARHLPRVYAYPCQACGATQTTTVPRGTMLTWTCGFCDTQNRVGA